MPAVVCTKLVSGAFRLVVAHPVDMQLTLSKSLKVLHTLSSEDSRMDGSRHCTAALSDRSAPTRAPLMFLPSLPCCPWMSNQIECDLILCQRKPRYSAVDGCLVLDQTMAMGFEEKSGAGRSRVSTGGFGLSFKHPHVQRTWSLGHCQQKSLQRPSAAANPDPKALGLGQYETKETVWVCGNCFE